MRLVVTPPSVASAPAFVVPGSGRALQTVAPLEGIEYVAAPRQLAPIAELAVRSDGGAQAPDATAAQRASAAAAAAGGGVAAYLAARAALLEGLPSGVDVAFEGVEGGKPTAVVRPLLAGALRDRGVRRERGACGEVGKPAEQPAAIVSYQLARRERASSYPVLQASSGR